MESTDTTLLKIIDEDYFTREHLDKLTNLLKRLIKTS